MKLDRVPVATSGGTIHCGITLLETDTLTITPRGFFFLVALASPAKQLADIQTGRACIQMTMAWLLVVAVLAGLAAGRCVATDHIVGANHGWNPNINYSLWSGNQTFYVGDLISFRYQKGAHNVFEVNQTGYDNCTMAGVAGNWTSGKDFIPLPEARRYYFICGNGFCLQGMKVAITVHPLPHNASAQGNRNGTQEQDSAAAAAHCAFSAAWMVALAVAIFFVVV